jgi:hypothetical protein
MDLQRLLLAVLIHVCENNLDDILMQAGDESCERSLVVLVCLGKSRRSQSCRDTKSCESVLQYHLSSPKLPWVIAPQKILLVCIADILLMASEHINFQRESSIRSHFSQYFLWN